ncbi:MAG: sulfurtransferase-like selenium metabolism protein YedF [Desulfobulbaceae bacterium]|nr:sulfurtransferase-like selenium metabolism protein YedF [Desulfobulbaceae bacterium]
MEHMKKLDCTGLNCPQPVILTKDALAEMTESELLVTVDNEASCSNVQRFAESQGHEVTISGKNGFYNLHISRGEGGAVSEEPIIECDLPSKKGIALYLSSEFLGKGDDELGAILMGAYVETLSHFANDISHIVLVNSAVKLAVEGASVLDHLQELEKMNIEVLACGTCLDFFKIKDKLQVGSVSNMFTILDILAKAPKVLTP